MELPVAIVCIGEEHLVRGVPLLRRRRGGTEAGTETETEVELETEAGTQVGLR